MRALITGADGYVGSVEDVPMLVAGHDVVGLVAETLLRFARASGSHASPSRDNSP